MRRSALLLAFAITACAGPRPAPPQSAGFTPPATWRDGQGATTRIDAEWWNAFGDPVMADLVQRALANNTDVAIAATRVEQARARYRQAGAQQLPDVNLSLGGGRDRHVSALGQPVKEWAGQGEVGISYDLDLFGRLRATTGAARAVLLASQDARDATRLAVAAATATSYIQLRALDARLIVLRETLGSRDEALRLAQRRSDAGYSTLLELRQADAERDDTAQLIPAAELAIRQQEDALALLLGDVPDAIPRGAPLDALVLPPAASVLPSSLLRRRPDIAAAEQQLVAADRSLDAARAAFLPSVQLNGAGGYQASTLLVGNPIGIFSLGGSILQTIFDGGRLRAQQRGAAAQRDEAAFYYRGTALRAFREVEDSLISVSKTSAQERELVRERQATSSLAALATRRYREGYSGYLEQIDAQRSLLASDLSVVQIRAQRLISAVTLFQALGGGWEGQASSSPSVIGGRPSAPPPAPAP